MQKEETKSGDTIVFEYDKEEYEMKIDVSSSALAIRITQSGDPIFWECEITEEDFAKKDKRWQSFYDLEEKAEFIVYAIKKEMFKLKITDEQRLTLLFKYQTPIKEIILTLTIPRVKLDAEKLMLHQMHVISGLKKKVKTLEEQLKGQLEESKSVALKVTQIVPVKVIDMNMSNHNTSYSTYSSSWTDIPSATGALQIQEKADVKWMFYANSMYSNQGGSYRIWFRVAVRNKSTDQIKYWPRDSGAGFYPDSCYANTMTISDLCNMEEGDYELKAQWKNESNSSSYQFCWYGNYGGEIKLLADIYCTRSSLALSEKDYEKKGNK